MLFVKAVEVAILSGLGGYTAGALLGMALIRWFSENRHNRAAEEATTGLLIVGPFAGLMTAFSGAAYYYTSQRGA